MCFWMTRIVYRSRKRQAFIFVFLSAMIILSSLFTSSVTQLLEDIQRGKWRDCISFTWGINQEVNKLCVKWLLALSIQYIMGMNQMKPYIPRGQRNASVHNHDLWMVQELSASETQSGRRERGGSRGWVIGNSALYDSDI